LVTILTLRFLGGFYLFNINAKVEFIIYMNLKLEVIPHTLNFKFNARTSRGAMQQHQVYYFKLYDIERREIFGLGECAPLPGLSPEYENNFKDILIDKVNTLNQKFKESETDDLESIIYKDELKAFPSVAFALETAWLDYKTGGNRILFQNDFTLSRAGIPINGLIWMGDKAFMEEQIKKKLKEGYSCLKLKIGGLDFTLELEILAAIRKVAPASDLIIRVDANGAFSPAEAQHKLEQLAVYDLHSIEQPIKAGQWEAMSKICAASPVPVALDEELIGITQTTRKQELLQVIVPTYIILKPTLLGGLKATAEWIKLAEEQGIGWWITSALESNIGLNAISQFTAQFAPVREQGLGTGQLYHNNIDSPLFIRKGALFYDIDKEWNLTNFNL
jgi:o-succinylbenzoate synthase